MKNRRVHKHRYSAEQDEAILKSKRGEFARLGECFGVTANAILARRRYLQRLASPFESAPKREVVISRVPLPFARPAWFDENLEVLSRGPKPFVSRLTQ